MSKHRAVPLLHPLLCSAFPWSAQLLRFLHAIYLIARGLTSLTPSQHSGSVVVIIRKKNCILQWRRPYNGVSPIEALASCKIHSPRCDTFYNISEYIISDFMVILNWLISEISLYRYISYVNFSIFQEDSPLISKLRRGWKCVKVYFAPQYTPLLRDVWTQLPR
jgi:hypothetical protein